MGDPRATGAGLTLKLRRTFGDELRGVVLFGSVARGEEISGTSDLNILVLLENMAPTRMARIAPLVQEWVRGGNTPPHLYTVDEWQGMTDAFAIEIADMVDAREVVWGFDPVTPDAVTREDLRLHAEREIRQTLLQLRLRLLLSASMPKDIGNLLMSGMPSFTAYMRASLRVAGLEAPLDSAIVIERAAALIDADPKPMLECWQIRRTTRQLAFAITDPVVENYIGFVQQLLAFLDRAPETDSTNINLGAREAPAAPAPH